MLQSINLPLFFLPATRVVRKGSQILLHNCLTVARPWGLCWRP